MIYDADTNRLLYTNNKTGEQSRSYTEQYMQAGNLYSLGAAKSENKNNSIHSSLGTEWNPDEKTSLFLGIGYYQNNSHTFNTNTTDMLNHSVNSIWRDVNSIPKQYKINAHIYEFLSKNKGHRFSWEAMASREMSEHIKLDFNSQYEQSKGENGNFANSTINYSSFAS